MADSKKIIFSLEIQGTDVAIRTQNDLTVAIKNTTEALKSAELGSEAYRTLEGDLGRLKNIQKDVADSARIVGRQFEVEAANGTGTYRSLNAELVNARSLFRELTKAEREGATGKELISTIHRLDTELKSVDASIGNFQRNVGNYPKELSLSFKDVTSQIGQVVPGFAQLDSAIGLVKSGVEGIGKTASATGKLLTGAFIGFQVISLILDGVKALKEFSEETNQLRGNIQKVAGVSEEVATSATSNIQAISATFNQDVDKTFKAANALVGEFGVSFDEATTLIENGFLAGANANGKFLDAITETAPKAAGAKASMEQFGVAMVEAGKAGLEEVRSIAAVARGAKEFKGTVDGLIDATNDLTIKQKAQLASDKELAEAKGEVAKKFDDLVAGVTVGSTSIQAYLVKAASRIIDFFKFYIGYVNGFVAAIRQIGDNVKNLFEEFGVNADIIHNKLQRINPFSSVSTEQLDNELTALKAKKEAFASAGRNVAEAAIDAFHSVTDAKAAEVTPAVDLEKLRAAKLAQEQAAAKTRAKAEQEAKDDAARRKAALEAESKYNDERVALLRELGKRLADAAIQNIDNQFDRQIAQENQKFADLQTEQKKQEETTVKQIAETREKIVAAYTENSKQVREFDAKAAHDLAQQQEQAYEIERQAVIARNLAIAKIQKEATDDQAKKRLESIKRELELSNKAYEDAAKGQAVKVQEAITKILKDKSLSPSEKDEAIKKVQIGADVSQLDTQIAHVQDVIAEVQARLNQLSAAPFVAATTEEFDFLTGKLKEFNGTKAELERKQAEEDERKARERAAKRREETVRDLEAISEIAEIANTFGRIQTERELANLQKQEDARNANISNIEKRLETATGVEKGQLELRLKNEQAALKKLTQEREKIEKEERTRAKAFAVIQSIIQTAVNVVKALGTGLIVPNIPAAILTGALGLAQTALIAAQPAAEGALIGMADTGNGLVVSAPNIPRMRNGDEILTTLKRGEVVLNARQQALLGGAPTFRAIRVPGFAEGGIAGSVISAPDITGISSAERVRMLEALGEQTVNYIKATNDRIDRIRTYVVSEDVQNDIDQRDRLKALAVLG